MYRSVLYPDALDFSWNSGWCCGESADKGRNDLEFIIEMVDIAINYHNIDSKRIYATGWSNGCAMAQALANKASSIFKKRNDKYVFSKNHKGKKEVLLDDYLKRFMLDNLDINKII